ncbi:uncharacterized protein LOC111709470 [Eurytemora carolleeae]|uniref:uncharacterized protein LOC111709470 n=1 Tax=Eurytemora carolleeae TaxID=1294199 RepID=UPI000C78F9F7|nr:uncharacterized protein LOC111709470 [Eurytemora carolleeae]|eukprot:XP_023338900.1 uncharacterized protein LOC111709470 [Eurytemora affinis]
MLVQTIIGTSSSTSTHSSRGSSLHFSYGARFQYMEAINTRNIITLWNRSVWETRKQRSGSELGSGFGFGSGDESGLDSDLVRSGTLFHAQKNPGLTLVLSTVQAEYTYPLQENRQIFRDVYQLEKMDKMDFIQISELINKFNAPWNQPILEPAVSANISTECQDSLDFIYSALLYGDASWPIRILDSTGRPQSGLGDGNFFWLGRFSECESIHQLPNGTTYSLAQLGIQVRTNASSVNLEIKQGICTPSTCFKDLRNVLIEFVYQVEAYLYKINITNISVNIGKISKISEGPNVWTDADGVSRLCCLLFFILLVLVSTTLDLIDTYIPSPPQTDQVYQESTDQQEYDEDSIHVLQSDAESQRSVDLESFPILNFETLQLMIPYNSLEDVSNTNEDDDVEEDVSERSDIYLIRNQEPRLPTILVQDWDIESGDQVQITSGSLVLEGASEEMKVSSSETLCQTEATNPEESSKLEDQEIIVEDIQVIDEDDAEPESAEEMNLEDQKYADDNIVKTKNETRVKSKEDSAKTSLKDEKEKREKYESEKVFSSLDSLPVNDYETERNERRQMVLLGMVESEYGLDYVDGEDPVFSTKGGWRSRTDGLSEEMVESLYQNQIKLDASACEIEEAGKDYADSTEHKSKTLSLRNCILSFSAIRNFRKIVNIDESSEDLNFLHGMRFLSMTWVILGHTFFFSLPYLDNLKPLFDEAKSSLSFQAVLQGTFAVDTFFFISGLLFTYLFFNKLTSKPGSVNTVIGWSQLIIHRFIRILPPYLALVVLLEPLSFFLCSGPLCPSKPGVNCGMYWWRNILNIQNFFHFDEMCAAWTWYLALDFQFFVLTVPVLVVFVLVPPLAAVILFGLLLGSWISTFLVAGQYNVSPDLLNSVFSSASIVFDVMYDKPWTRAGPYIVGLVSGYTLHRLSKSGFPIMTFSKQLVCWLVSTVLALGLVYGLYEDKLTSTQAQLYSTFARSTWALVLAWISVSCGSGFGGIINWILSLPGLRPLSRLTYTAYLIHPLIMLLFYSNLEVPYHGSILGYSLQYTGFLLTSYGAALLYSLVFEAPWINIQKLFGI